MSEATEENSQQGSPSRSDRSRPIKPLPTDRLTIDSQLSVLRGYAATSGNERKAVSNDEIGKTINMNPNSVSLCNPFFESVGLIVRDGRKQRPTDLVFDYFQAYQWNPDTAATKLASAFANAWFCDVLVPKLSFRPLSRIEAASFLADEVKASKEYRDNLFLLLEYLKHAGIVSIDGDTISIIQNRQQENKAPQENAGQNASPEKAAGGIDQLTAGMKRFAIHVPDKNDAVVFLPDDIDQEDWEMVLEVLQKYVTRWKKFS